MNFDPTFENEQNGDFPSFVKIGNFGASWPFCGLHQNFSGIIGLCKNMKQKFSLNLKIFAYSVTVQNDLHFNSSRVWIRAR